MTAGTAGFSGFFFTALSTISILVYKTGKYFLVSGPRFLTYPNRFFLGKEVVHEVVKSENSSFSEFPFHLPQTMRNIVYNAFANILTLYRSPIQMSERGVARILECSFSDNKLECLTRTSVAPLKSSEANFLDTAYIVGIFILLGAACYFTYPKPATQIQIQIKHDDEKKAMKNECNMY